jgi:hypothetical protein
MNDYFFLLATPGASTRPAVLLVLAISRTASDGRARERQKTPMSMPSPTYGGNKPPANVNER